MQNYSIELKPIDRLVNGVVEFLKLFFGQQKVISNHFLQKGFAGSVSIDVLADDVTDVFDGMDIMDTLVFLMVLDTALCLTDGTGAGTGETRADLNAFTVVEFTD